MSIYKHRKPTVPNVVVGKVINQIMRRKALRFSALRTPFQQANGSVRI